MSDFSILRDNANCRYALWAFVVLFTLVSLAWGLFMGKDLLGEAWSNSHTVLHLFVACFAGWRLYRVPQQLQLAETLISRTNPVLARVVVEKGDDGDGTTYALFIRSGELAEAGFSSWRAEVLMPYPTGIEPLVERDSEAWIWFSADRKPKVAIVADVVMELGSSREAVNRWVGG